MEASQGVNQEWLLSSIIPFVVIDYTLWAPLILGEDEGRGDRAERDGLVDSRTEHHLERASSTTPPAAL